jgi:signal transduction histidine kinase
MAEQLAVGPRTRVQRGLGRFTAADWAPALALTAFAQLNLRFGLDNSSVFGPPAAAASVTAIATAVLVLRRRLPLTTVVVVAAAVALPEILTTLTITLWGDLVPLLIAVYSVARHADRARAASGLLLAAAAVAFVMLRIPVLGTTGNIPFTAVPMLGLFVLGLVLRQRAERHQELARSARALEHERAAQIEQAIADERARIARELHDLVAHSVSVMVVQAGAAEDLLDRNPAAAREPLGVVQETGRQAVQELSTMLGLLRRPPGPVELAPQPDERGIPALVERIRASGLDLEARIGDVPPLPPGIGLALYRVTQEGLTNALKHAPGGTATLALAGDGCSVTLEIVNGLGARGSASVGTGNGLVGIRERVAVHGGTMEAGRTDDGRFRLRVLLPLPAGRR